MTKLSIPSHTGHGPHVQFLKDFNIAFAKGELDSVMESFSDDVVWEMAGHRTMRGKAEIRELLTEMSGVAKELVIDSMISEDDRCAVNGKLVYDEVTIVFCDVYTLTGAGAEAKIKLLTAYAVEV